MVGKHYLLSLNKGPIIRLFANRKFNNSLKVPASVQSFPDSPGDTRDSWPCTVPLRVNPCASAAFVNGQLVLDLGNILTIISK